MTFHQLIYTSRPTVDDVEGELMNILKTAQTENYKHRLSGLLVYHGGKFMQLLEGDETELKQLFRNISRDSRHADIEVLLERDGSKRCFATWAMGFAMTAQGENDVLSEQAFSFVIDDIKDICAALNNDVGRAFLTFLDSEAAD